jgi:hypothetical protein
MVYIQVYFNNHLELEVKEKKLESSRIVTYLDIAAPKKRQVATLIRAS